MKQLVLYIISFLLFSTSATAQVKFRTSELQRLAKTLNIDASTLPEGFSHPTAKGLHLTIRVEDQMVDHIGLQLFSDDIRSVGNSPIFDFLERYFLLLKYPPSVKTANLMMRDDQFQFLNGSLNTIDDLRPTDGFSYNYDKHRYTATWNRDGQTLLSVSFPVEYELISGENKIEAEENLQRAVRKAVVRKQQDNRQQNDTYLDLFSNRLYFAGAQLIASSQHPAETAANMMLSTNAPGNYSLSTTQISYGFKRKVFDVPLRQWIAFCQNNGCQLYFGVENMESNGDISAVVLAVNESENYNHVLTVTIPADIIDHRQGALKVRLYPYIPTHNVMNMFATYRKSNPKNYISR